jgi:hypothetical protein
MYTFVLNTTIGKVLTIQVDANTTTNKLYELFMDQLEHHTVFCKNEILDIFAQDTLNNNILSFPKNDLTVKSFIHQNRDFYPPSIMVKDKYELYVIDFMYNERIKENVKNVDKIPPSRQMKTSHADSFIQSFKRLFV